MSLFRLPGLLTGGWRSLAGSGESELVPQSRLSGPMPWVIAIMIALMVIAGAAALALRNTAQSAREDLSGGITVQIVEAAPEARQQQAAAALERLKAIPGIVSAELIPSNEVDALIEPWLGAGTLSGVDAIPVPAMLDARLDGKVSAGRIADIQSQLKAVAPAARVDAQSSWLGPVFDAIQSLQWLAVGVIVLLGLCTGAAVLLAARTALGANRGTIEVVHLLGGTDAQIARIFQRSIGRDAVGGGAVGLALGLTVILFVGQRFAALGAGVALGGALGWSDWALLLAIPFAGVVLAMLTARLTVLRALRRML